MKQLYLMLAMCLFFQSHLHGQISFSVSPSKLYFHVAPGETGQAAVTVTNGGNQERSYSATFAAWDRNSSGAKQFSSDTGQVYSCADMLTAQPSVFNLSPGEQQIVTINLTHTGTQKVPAQWAMLMIRELNAQGPAAGARGVSAVLNIQYQIGIHVYQELPGAKGELELQVDTMYLSHEQEKKQVNIHLRNTSGFIGEVRLEASLFSMNANQATSLPVRSLTVLPERDRTVTLPLPDHLKSGDYTITVSLDPGQEYDLLVADLYFNVPAD